MDKKRVIFRRQQRYKEFANYSEFPSRRFLQKWVTTGFSCADVNASILELDAIISTSLTGYEGVYECCYKITY